ncbi:MAG: hypothetical protein LBK25_08390 [Treponema sp.]|nr:hypothetical protein [Treponema sp.]
MVSDVRCWGTREMRGLGTRARREGRRRCQTRGVGRRGLGAREGGGGRHARCWGTRETRGGRRWWQTRAVLGTRARRGGRRRCQTRGVGDAG